MDVNMFIAICYQAYSEAINRDGFCGLKPTQEHIDLFWNRELAPRISAKYKKAIVELAKAEEQKKEKDETTTKTAKKTKEAK